MHSMTKYLRFVALLMVATVICTGCPGLHVKDPFAFFYYPKDGRKVPLILHPSAIVFEPSLDNPYEGWEETVAAIVQSEPNLGYPQFGPVNQLLAPLTPGLSDEEVLDLIARLNRNPDVDWANPVVVANYRAALIHCRYCGAPTSVNAHFIAVFPASVPTEEIDALNAAYAMEGFESERNEAEVVYEIRTSKESVLTTLEAANLYHEHPLTLRAYPLFSPTVWQ